MIVYRVGRSKYAEDLSGEGARRFGGRWNHKSVTCLYTSQSKALAVLEYTVNVNIEDIPRALSITSLEIPDRPLKILREADLPGDWKEFPAPFSTREFGSDLLTTARYPIIRIPSAIIPGEFNFLLNPMHKDSRKFKIVEIRDFVYVN